MDEKIDNINPLTGKKRKISNGSELGDQTESYHAAEKREDRLAILKKFPGLQRYFSIDQYHDLEEKA